MGLKFTPTPEKSNTIELENDLNDFFRKVRLCEYFDGVEHDDVSLVRNKTSFVPPSGRNLGLENYIATSQSMFNNYPKENKNIKHNITLEQRRALKSLSEDDSIIIKEADKGGGIVLMNTNFYKLKILEMLTDQSYYRSIPNSDQKHIFDLIKRLISCNGNLTNHEHNFLLDFDCKTSTFYGLPKIHKCKLIQDACKMQDSEYIEVLDPLDLQFRPIVAGPNCETSRLSCCIDILLKPFLVHVKSYLRDDIDFLNRLPKTVTMDTKIVSFDVVSLYSNIPHDLGLDAISFWLDKHPELIPHRFSKQFIIEGIQIILENNNFSFNGSFYNQTKGTAMGTKMAPSYATLVLGFLEEQLYTKLKETKGDQFANIIAKKWERFLDDCFILWPYSIEELIKFQNCLNSLHKDIQFKLKFSSTELSFLDVLVKKINTTITTDIFFKITDSKQYLNFKSCHPKHTKINIPFNLARRICTIVSDPNTLSFRLKELVQILIERQYPLEIISSGIYKALGIPRSELLCVHETSKTKLVPFISTHNPHNREIFGMLKNNLDILGTDETMKKVIDETKIIKCKRQPPNLKRLLVKSEFNENSTPPSVSKCNEQRCGLCSFIIEGSTLVLDDKTFHVKVSMNCAVRNVLYVLVCNGCRQFYIGQTGDKLRNRRTVHDQQIRDPSTRQIPLSTHIDQCCSTFPKFSIFPFYKFNTDDVSARLLLEKHFINVFKPSLNML